jgi:hypothetical protein
MDVPVMDVPVMDVPVRHRPPSHRRSRCWRPVAGVARPGAWPWHSARRKGSGRRGRTREPQGGGHMPNDASRTLPRPRRAGSGGGTVGGEPVRRLRAGTGGYGGANLQSRKFQRASARLGRLATGYLLRSRASRLLLDRKTAENCTDQWVGTWPREPIDGNGTISRAPGGVHNQPP